MNIKKKKYPAASADNIFPSLPNLTDIKLPKPSFPRVKTVANALLQRKTIREISDKKLPLQMLSNLLWAACGVNRNKVTIGINGRTAASASNSQEIDLYVAMQDYTYLYDASHHRLIPTVAEDLRSLALGRGQPDVAPNAPVRLIYVVDIDKLSNTSGYREPGLKDPEIQKSYYFVDTGLIAGNIYLFAASSGMETWFHNCDKSALATKLKLRSDQRVLFAQTFGYPLKAKKD